MPQPYLGFTSLLALIASFAVHAALAGVMLLAATRVMPVWAVALLTLVVAT